MRKHLLLAANSFSTVVDGLEVVHCVINETLAERIKSLHSTVNSLDLHSIEILDWASTWSGAYIDPSDLGENNDNLDAIVAEIKEYAERCEIKTIRITPCGFYLTAIGEHKDDSDKIETALIGITELDSDAPYVRLDQAN